MVKALVEGFGGGIKKTTTTYDSYQAPTEAQEAMQNSVLSEVVARSGPALPMVRGRDHELPKNPPVFDIDTMRQRNEAIAAKRNPRLV